MLPRPVELFVEDLQNNHPDYLGTALFGSWARGDNRPDSDIDLLIITSLLDRRAIEKVGKYNIEIVYTTEEGARNFAKGRMDDFLNMWRDAKVLFDHDGGLERLRDFAVQSEGVGKPSMPSWKVQHAEFDARDSIHAATELQKWDETTAELHLQRTVYNLLQLYFDKSQFWTPPPKKRLPWLREHDGATAEKFDAFYRASTLVERIKVAEAVADHVFRAGI